MGDNTGINWCDASANVVLGCTRKSDGCQHCYAERLAATRLKEQPRYMGLAVMSEKGRPQWTGEVRIVREAMKQVVRWKRPRKVFLTAMGDPFHESLTFEQIAEFMSLTAAAPQHTFQILTKRPDRMEEFFRKVPASAVAHHAGWFLRQMLGAGKLTLRQEATMQAHYDRLGTMEWQSWPYPNVWLGTSVENQATAEERIPHLMRTPAVVRWLSCEPLLGPVDLERAFAVIDGNGEPSGPRTNPDGTPAIAWCVCGGESGPKARPFDLVWARSIVKQCREAGVAVWVKQLGAKPVCSACGSTGTVAAPNGEDDHQCRVCGGMFRDGEIIGSRGANSDLYAIPYPIRVRQFPGEAA